MDYKITKITDYSNSEFQSAFISYFNETGIEIKRNTDLWNIMQNTKDMYCYAIETAEQIIGFIMFQQEYLKSSTEFFNERVGYIRELYVRKEFRKSGFGRLLLD
ncbi:MAG: GNAT family N-acetyltransferase, partial [Eubacterium sp.]|nr:GNAT family N-acetyltransferase [Eubacterium sp.]